MLLAMRTLVFAILLLSQALVAQAPPPIGFAAGSSNRQAEAERVFLDTVTPASARRWLAALTEEPHVAGTPAEKKLADYVLERFREFGLSAELVRYDVFLNHPLQVSLKLTAPVEEELKLREEPYEVDKDSTQTGMFPAFHGYGASGKAEGQVVYVNYGSPADFARLETMGVSVEGRIALVRYGGLFRGLKVKEAQDRGAVGVLIYSDPRDDGYMAG
jgi:N-acetylated-alpha-linked acidic dipeptidase